MKYTTFGQISGLAAPTLSATLADAGVSLFGYFTGAETFSNGATEVVQTTTSRWGKGFGDDTAYDSKTELEYGVTDRFTRAEYLLGQSVKTQGIQSYVSKDAGTGLKLCCGVGTQHV